MSVRRALIPTAEAARKLAGPAFADIRDQVTIRTRLWSGTYIREGTPADTDLVLPPHYPVRYVTAQEVSSSGGVYRLEDLIVNHITPFDGIGVGYTDEQLAPTVTDNRTEIIYIVTDPNGDLVGEYTLVDLRSRRPFSRQLVLRRRLTTP